MHEPLDRIIVEIAKKSNNRQAYPRRDQEREKALERSFIEIVFTSEDYG